MTSILGAVISLGVGAGLALTLRTNRARSAASLLSQLLAVVLVEAAVVPVLLGGEPLTASLAWSYPVGLIPLRVDALSGFFLAFSLPMTLLGTLYATGYLEPYL